jgi:hypothetical protein
MLLLGELGKVSDVAAFALFESGKITFSIR